MGLKTILVSSVVAAVAADCKDHPLLQPSACGNAPAPDLFSVTHGTTKGAFTIEVNTTNAPLGAQRFYNLARLGYYSHETEAVGNNAGFFRYVPGFVVQWGIAGLPAVSAAWENEVIADDAVILSNIRGTIAYAAVQDNTGKAVNRTTQVYINLADNSALDAMGFTVFGTINDAGMKIIDSLYSGYGQDPDQDSIYSDGDDYLQKNYPLMDYITSTIVKER